ncbi:MAG: DUF411 domain-containing protein [Pseudaminobacter sp.]
MERLSRRALFSLAGGCLTLVVGGNLAGEARAAATVVDVARSPSCGCCGAWIEHIRAAGFTVQDRLVEDLAPLKAQLGVPAALQSCHTAVVEGYVIEGHVPAADIRRLIEERPSGIGLAVAGMPVGSPGMEVGDEHEPYEVILFGADSQTVFARY